MPAKKTTKTTESKTEKAVKKLLAASEKPTIAAIADKI